MIFYGRTNSILKRKFSTNHEQNRALVHPKSGVTNDPRVYPRLFSGTKLVFRNILFCISSRNTSLVRNSVDSGTKESVLVENSNSSQDSENAYKLNG